MLKHKVFIVFIGLFLLPAFVFAQTTIYKIWYSASVSMPGGCANNNISGFIVIGSVFPAYSKNWGGSDGFWEGEEYNIYSISKPTEINLGGHTGNSPNFIEDGFGGGSASYSIEAVSCPRLSSTMSAAYSSFKVVISSDNSKVLYCQSEKVTLSLPETPSSVDWYIQPDGGSKVLYRTGGKSLEVKYDEVAAFMTARGVNPIRTNFNFSAVATYNGFTVDVPASTPIAYEKDLPKPGSVSAEAPKCYGQNGFIHFTDIRTPSGAVFTGSPAFYIKLDNGVTVTNVLIDKANVDVAVPPGRYDAAAVEFAGSTESSACVWKSPSQIVIDPALQIIPVTSISCYNGAPAVTLSASGGKAPYQFSIGSIVNPADNLFTGLTPGTAYTAVVTDANACSVNKTVTMLAAVTVSNGAIVAPSGGAANGSVTLVAGGGSGAPYMYSKDGTNWQTGATFAGLGAGTYRFYSKDNAGCISATPLNITLQALDFTMTTTAASCSDVADGVIRVTVTGGAPPYSYKLNSDAYRASAPVFSFLSGGTYTVWVRDANGVELNKPATVSAPPAMTITKVTATDAICRDMNNGTITVTASGGNGAYTYYINNALPQTTNVFTVAAGTYTMRVDDSKGCTVNATPVTVSQPALKVAVSTTVTDVACYNTPTGIINVSGLNGTAPYTFNIDGGAWQSVTKFTVGADTYTIAVKDAKGCENSVSGVKVNTPAQLTLQQDVVTPVSCYGYTDGQVRVIATGGTGTIRYYINTAPLVATAGTFTGLTAGTYTITAKDDNNCTTTINVTVTQPTQIDAQAVATDARCFGQSNGSVRVNNVTGGNGGYTFAIDNIAFGTSPQFDNLPANNYTIYIKDQKGCRGQETAVVSQLSAVDFTMTGSDALCNAGATGELRITASGGTNTYTYSVDGAVFGTSPVITALTAGNRTITVKDGNGCQLSKSWLTEEPSALLLSATSIGKVSCFGGNNGSITVKATGGTVPYTYAINSGGFQATGLFENLRAGVYNLTVKDGHGCTTTIQETVTEFSKMDIDITTKTDVLCAGASTGAISLIAKGGAGTYAYNFNNAGYQSESNWSGLPAGNYPLIVKDQNGCEQSFSLPIVDLYAPLSVDLVSNPPASCDDKGSIVIRATNGGLTPYAYSLDDLNYTSATTFDQLLNGDYTVYIKDANGCIITRVLSPYGPVTIRGVVTPSAVSCKNGTNGSLTVSGVTGGNSNYEYSLDGTIFQSSPVFTGLKAGAYTVHVRDVPYSCHIVISSGITEPALLEPVLTDKKLVKCFGEKNGALTLTARGGVGTYEWSIDGVNYQSTGVFDQLGAGNYTGYVRDRNACISQLPVTISQPDALAARISAQQAPGCYGETNGKIELVATGGTLPYSYQLNSSVQTLPAFTGLAHGHYAMKVTDANACNVSFSTDLVQPELFTLSLVTKDDVQCFGRSEGRIEVAAAGGTAAYSFSLNNLPAQSGPVFEHLPAGDYLLLATDAHGCKANISERISQPTLLTFSKEVKQPVCSYSADASIAVAMNGGTLPYSYNWSNGAIMPRIDKLEGGIYSVTMTDAHGCELTDQTVIIQPEEIKIDLGFRDTVLCVGQQLHLSAGNPGKQYLWQSDAGFNATTQQVTIGEGGNYTLTVTNEVGCFAKAAFSLQTSLEALTTEFLVSSYNAVGDTVVIMDVSRPKPSRLEWTLPIAGRDAGSNADGSIRLLIFDKPGTYDIGLLARLGECASSIQKSITILPRDEQGNIDSLLGYREKLIKEIIVSPNPASTQYKVDIRLTKQAAVNVRVISFNNGQIVDMKQSSGSDTYQLSFDAERLQQGIYLIGVQVGDEYQVKKLLKL
ncbi:T9SS type A sorting domain-containing protein [Chitinophaga sp. CF418]|uniref:T9SS type A sorting domain-containing protein n=1 Tax=Chitinophaga sp. CF418 TaxID=1855287 RepID=UPI000912CC38|nr:T9SS type A sorting domain-containing protein [Chitinophaga sp. CF418]SHN38786.1 Por secretion system C-terminal sorting domain-containing protein [Chitinophaga sp. CF418]